MGRDYHKKGQQDQKKSRNDSFVDIIRSGGSSPHYRPPKNKADRDTYKSGRDNAKKNR